eukprot:TRINITY_DN54380_c0_g1_i1.p1 TRINITY_DN54380_c0_g1~~TRINITY_DN54380_c0_g1_i1.p1  ORF type:complete len:733 (-),score=227.13 TRINITY_DN54380_c0_g1_i1:250-2448(-)
MCIRDRPSLYDKLFGEPEPAATSSKGMPFDPDREEDDNSINFETFKLFMNPDGPAVGKRGGGKKAEQAEADMLNLFKCFDKDRTGLVTIKNLRTVSAEMGNSMNEKELRGMIQRAKEHKRTGGRLKSSRPKGAAPGQRALSQHQQRMLESRASKAENKAGKRKQQARDKYELLGLEDDPRIQIGIIKEKYLDKEMRLQHLKEQAKCSPEDEAEFERTTAAYKVLTDPVTKLLYDSAQGPLSYEVPSPFEDFFGTYPAVFRQISRYSVKELPPSLGDESSSKREVEDFYSFWEDFKSWRDFGFVIRGTDPAESLSREERRMLEKESRKESDKRKRAEEISIAALVSQAKRLDPRLNSLSEIATAQMEYTSVNAAQANSRGLQKLRNRARSALSCLKLGSDSGVEVVDVLFNVLDADDVQRMCVKLEKQKSLTPSQAQTLILNLLDSAPQLAARSQVMTIFELATAQSAIKPPPSAPAKSKASRKRKNKNKPSNSHKTKHVLPVSDDDEVEPNCGGEMDAIVVDGSSSCSSSEPEETDSQFHRADELREKLCSLQEQLQIAKQNDDFETCIALRDLVKLCEQELAQAVSAQNVEVNALRTQLDQRLGLLRQQLAQMQREMKQPQAVVAKDTAVQQERAFLDQIRAEQDMVLAELEKGSAMARAEVAAIPSVLAQLQSVLATTDDETELTQEHEDAQKASDRVLATLRKCQPFTRRLEFDSTVKSALQCCRTVAR